MKVVESIKDGSLVYQSKRPQLNVKSCGWADCSGFVGWCLRNFFPDAWNNGNCNTNTIYTYFLDKHLIVGTGNDLVKMQGDLGIRRGDLVLFGENLEFKTGSKSHIGIFMSDDTIKSVGNGKSPHTVTVKNQLAGRNQNEVYAIIRPFQNKEEKPTTDKNENKPSLSTEEQNVLNWINENTGKWIDIDGMYGAQCMDLAVAYALHFWNFQLTGNAENLRNQQLPNGWQRIQNHAGFIPKLGDIFIWYGQNHPYGHTGIVIEGYDNSYKCLNQNTAGTHGGVGSEAVVSTWEYTRGPFWGVVRPPIN